MADAMSAARPTSIADFHTHSSRSDGLLAPAQLIDHAAARGVRIMALTDHDTLDGYAEAATRAVTHPGFLLVPGVELSCDVPGTEVHMLGLGIDPHDEALLATLTRLRAGRVDRARGMVEALARLGAPIEWERVQAIAGAADSVGRPHIAHALVEAGHVASFNEAFDRYLGRNAPAYVERSKLAPPDAVEMIRRAGGIAVFAHPTFTENYEQMAHTLRDAGLFGLEAYYKAYTPRVIARLLALAHDLGLFATGGSDFHGIDRPDERNPGEIPLPEAVAWALLAQARARGAHVPDGDADDSTDEQS